MEAKVKEELPDKEYSQNNNNNDRRKATSKDHRSPEAEDVRVSPTPGQPAPLSPHNNGSAEPLSPPLCETARSAALQRLRRFLSALQQFATDSSSETAADRVRQYIHGLVAGTISVEEFCAGVAECTMYPLRASVPGFLRTLLPPAQAHLHLAARTSKLTLPQYLRLHEHQILDTGGDPSDIFGPQPSSISDLGVKRRISDALYEHPSTNGLHEDYQPPPKRPLTSGLLLNPPLLYPLPSNATLFDYNSYHGYHGQGDGGFERRDGGISVRDVSSMNASFSEPRTLASSAGLLKTDDEWKNINTMLNCILSMVEKTKRALAILQQRGVEPTESSDVKRVANEIMAAAVRQTEERVSEVRRRAEDAVNQVKRQALLELQRAVGAAEAKALELVAAERGKMERLLTERLQDRRSPPQGADGSPNAAQQNCCWNCGRKAQETCSGCNSARYCGAFCQHKDWEHHHQVCSGRDQKPVTSQTSSPPATHPKPTTRSSTPISISDRHPSSSTERITINPERVLLNPERVPLNPDRVLMNLDRVPMNQDRVPMNQDRVPLNTDRVQINPERLQLNTELIQLSERLPQAENRLSLSSLNTAERMLSSTQDRSVPGNSERIALANLSTAQGLIGGVGGKK